MGHVGLLQRGDLLFGQRQLLGGPLRDRARVYAWVGGDEPGELADAVAGHVAAGMTAGLGPVELMMVRSRIAGVLAAGLLVVVLAWVAWLLVGGWQVRAGLTWARGRMAEGQYAPARDRLARLADWWPRDDEVVYLLGTCEAKLGRPEAAFAAWRSVPSGSRWTGSARLAEGRTLELEEFKLLLTGKIARYKIPAHLRVIEALPLTPSGKVQKFKLKEMFADE